jgi:hypothetical protein
MASRITSIYSEPLDAKDIVAALVGLGVAVAVQSVTDGAGFSGVVWVGAPAAFILARRSLFPRRPPESVLVQWADGQRYPALVIDSTPAHVHVVFPDGRRLWVERTYVSQLDAPAFGASVPPVPGLASVSSRRRWVSYVGVLVVLVLVAVVLAVTRAPVGGH